MTKYTLSQITANPYRNIERYPINREKVERLKESIGRTEFWDNLVARSDGDGAEIAYGHHRLVALKELYPPDHVVNLIVRDLDDAAMLHIMADENMAEWGLNQNEAIVETVRAVRDFLDTSVARPEYSGRGRPHKSNGVNEIVTFLGWKEGTVDDALAIINAEESGLLKPEDTTGLTLKQATVMRQSVARIKDPKVRKDAIKQVRAEVSRPGKERVGTRGIPEVVRQVREKADPTPKPVVPLNVAMGVERMLENFFSQDIHVGRQILPLREVIMTIAVNRDAEELQGLTSPMADQIAHLLVELSSEATRLSLLLREGKPLAVLIGAGK